MELKAKLQTALQLHQTGEALQAEKLYREILQIEPDHADVLHFLGILKAQQSNFETAKELLTKAVKLEPESASFHNSLANTLKNIGQLKQAISHYKIALKLEPNYATAYNNLANIFLIQQNLTKAKTYYLKALENNPEYIDANYNVAIILRKQNKDNEALECLDKILALKNNHAAAHNQKAEIKHQQGEFELALHHYKECLKLDPLNPELFHNIGAIFIEQGNPTAALKYYLRLLQIAPDFDIYYNLGVIYMYQGRPSDAILYFKKALQQNPDHFATHSNLGAIYLKAEDYNNAILHYKIALKLEPKNSEITYILNAITEEQTPAAAPKEYIKNLFDQYAPNFDQHLTAMLDYKAPELLYDAVAKNKDEITATWKVLDLGCGTGLAGAKFRPLAKQLIGVDLSEKMIAVAREKNIYDVLHVADIEKILRQYHNLDLIIAADTLVYIGKLDKIFALCKRALKNSGIFAFTIEATDKYPYTLQKSARFAHHQQYIEELATQNGLNITC
ncbi:MAG: tetratricopeptide repeat protein, partial [Gammaproteobacteria bacterium]|nr:tetratricopeptide repeat protein [Gammaproteobacteria bacterium]